MPTTISSPTTPKFIQKAKNYIIGSKIEVHKFTKGSVHIVHNMRGPTQASACTMHDYLREKPCTSMNDAFMDLVDPSTTFSLTPNMI